MRCMLNFYPVKNVLNIYLGYVFLGSLVEYMRRQWHGLLYQTLDGALVMAATTRYVRPKMTQAATRTISGTPQKDTCSWKIKLERTWSWKVLSWKVKSWKVDVLAGMNRTKLESFVSYNKSQFDIFNFNTSFPA